MSILVTGGAGYIGSHTVYALLDAGHSDIVVIDNLSKGYKHLLPPQVKFYKGDAGDQAFVSKVLKKHKIDTVLHFAGSIVVPESVAEPLAYYKNNTVGSHSLISACVASGVKNFIFSSTAAIYGNNPLQLMHENYAPAPENPYAWSKLMTERMIQDIAPASGMRYAILRYFNVAGADPKGRTGQITAQATHLIKVACEAVSGKRTGMKIFGTDYPTPDGTCVRDYIHVSDLAQAHLAAWRYLTDKNTSGIFNCGYGRGYSVREVVRAVEKISGTGLKIEEAPRRAGDAIALVADATNLRQATGWTPHHDNLDDIVRTALAWEKSDKNKA